MIAKRINRGRARGTPTPAEKARRIRGLIQYVVAPHAKGGDEKCRYWNSTGFTLGDTPESRIRDMTALAQSIRRGADPVEHIVIAWPPGEQPTIAQADEAAKIALETLGFQEHLALWGLHEDRDHLHLHLVVNRVHPETQRMTKAEWIIDRTHQAVALIEQRQGWMSKANALYEIEDDTLVRQRDKRDAPALTQPAQAYEQRTSKPSAQRVAQESIPDLSKCKTWADAHVAFAAAGLKYEKKGSGAIITTPSGEALKASTVARSFSLSNLTKRLGGYEPAPPALKVAPTPEPAPLVPKTFQSEFQTFDREREAESARAQRSATKRRSAAEKAALAKHQREERDEALTGHWTGLGLARNALSAAIADKHREDREALKAKHAAEPSAEKTVTPTFPEKLQKAGRRKDALAVKTTVATPPVVPDRPPRLPPPVSCPQLDAFDDYHAAINAESYTITATKTVNGRRIGRNLSGKGKSATPNEVRSKIFELRKLEKRGENIYLTPRSESAHHIVVDDLSARNFEEFKNAGFTPAVVLETSPANFQAIIKLPKHVEANEEIERAVANETTKTLNRNFGDPKLSGAAHAHRFPGFKNNKPKYAPNFPTTRIVALAGEVCKRTIEFANKIRERVVAEFEAAAKRRAELIANTIKNRANAEPKAPHDSRMAALYRVHAVDIAKRTKITDPSRLDYMIAVRLRATGADAQQIGRAIRSASPELDKRKSNASDYVKRTVAAVFTPRADREIERLSKWIPKWRELEAAEVGREKTRAQDIAQSLAQVANQGQGYER